jgi:hypothetical protein
LVQALKYENFEEIDEDFLLNSDQIGINDEVISDVSSIINEIVVLSHIIVSSNRVI